MENRDKSIREIEESAQTTSAKEYSRGNIDIRGNRLNISSQCDRAASRNVAINEYN